MSLLRTIALCAAFVCMPCVAAEQSKVLFLHFPATDAAKLGRIDKLIVRVSCSWIASLVNMPELYDIRTEYDTPTENVFEAVPRVGSVAVDLRRWNGVIGVRVPPDADAKSCFAVTVTAESSYNSAVRHWTGRQLGLSK